MAAVGLFFEKHFKNKEVFIFSGVENENLNYSQSNQNTWNIVHGIFIEYDQESDILTFETVEEGKIFHMFGWYIHCFWPPGTKFDDLVKDTNNRTPSKVRRKNRDIM